MTDHPARPAGYRPFVDASDLTGELQDIDRLTRDVFGADVPLHDRVAVLVADWQDTTAILNGGHVDTFSASDIDLRQRDRRGLS